MLLMGLSFVGNSSSEHLSRSNWLMSENSNGKEKIASFHGIPSEYGVIFFSSKKYIDHEMKEGDVNSVSISSDKRVIAVAD
jgi:hypothetical protein